MRAGFPVYNVQINVHVSLRAMMAQRVTSIVKRRTCCIFLKHLILSSRLNMFLLPKKNKPNTSMTF